MIDGEMDDLVQAKQMLVKLSYQPCSIIIMGVGAAKFPKMYALNN
jgi:hypothetical protein